MDSRILSCPGVLETEERMYSMERDTSVETRAKIVVELEARPGVVWVESEAKPERKWGTDTTGHERSDSSQGGRQLWHWYPGRGHQEKLGRGQLRTM